MVKQNLARALCSPYIVPPALGLVVIAGARFAYALIIALALLWVYGVTAFIVAAARRVFPRVAGDMLVAALAALAGSAFYLALSIINPFLARDLTLALLLVPVCCWTGGVARRMEKAGPLKSTAVSLGEAGLTALIIVFVALIREPLGYGTLSLPGGVMGSFIALSAVTSFLVPLRILDGASGALLLLGYIVACLRLIIRRNSQPNQPKPQKTHKHPNQHKPKGEPN